MSFYMIKMYKQFIIVVLFGFCIAFSSVQAKDSTYQAFVKGSFAKIQQNHKGMPYLISFWSESCAYCMKELALFGQLLKQYPNIKLITVSTDPFLDDKTVQSILLSKNLEQVETWVFADDFSERLYFDVNSRWRGELPLTYFFGRDHKMIRHMGVVKEDELLRWLTDQSK